MKWKSFMPCRFFTILFMLFFFIESSRPLFYAGKATYFQNCNSLLISWVWFMKKKKIPLWHSSFQTDCSSFLIKVVTLSSPRFHRMTQWSCSNPGPLWDKYQIYRSFPSEELFGKICTHYAEKIMLIWKSM